MSLPTTCRRFLLLCMLGVAADDCGGGKCVEFNGHLYRTLDGTLPTETAHGCQVDALLMPDGWELPQADGRSDAETLACAHPWGTRVVVYGTTEGDSARSTLSPYGCGWHRGSNIAYVQVDGPYYRPSHCNRILIRRPANISAIITSTTSSTSSTTSSVSSSYTTMSSKSSETSTTYTTVSTESTMTSTSTTATTMSSESTKTSTTGTTVSTASSRTSTSYTTVSTESTMTSTSTTATTMSSESTKTSTSTTGTTVSSASSRTSTTYTTVSTASTMTSTSTTATTMSSESTKTSTLTTGTTVSTASSETSTSYTTVSTESTMTSTLTTATTMSSESTKTSTSTTGTTVSSAFSKTSTSYTTLSTESTSSTADHMEDLVECSAEYMLCPVPAGHTYIVEGTSDPQCTHQSAPGASQFQIRKAVCPFMQNYTKDFVIDYVILVPVLSPSSGLTILSAPRVRCSCKTKLEFDAVFAFTANAGPETEVVGYEDLSVVLGFFPDASYNQAVASPQPNQDMFFFQLIHWTPETVDMRLIEVLRVIAAPSDDIDSPEGEVLYDLENCSVGFPGLDLQVRSSNQLRMVRDGVGVRAIARRASMKSLGFPDAPKTYLFFIVRQCAEGLCGICPDQAGRRMQAAALQKEKNRRLSSAEFYSEGRGLAKFAFNSIENVSVPLAEKTSSQASPRCHFMLLLALCSSLLLLGK